MGDFLITAWSNAVNLTDGLDGLAAGSSAMVFAAYTLIGVWQTNQSCQYRHHDVWPRCATRFAIRAIWP